MRTPSPVAAIAERRQRTATEIARSNETYIATLVAVVVEAVKTSSKVDSSKVQDRRERRGIPYVGTGGIDVRRDPLLEVLDREHQRERAARIRSRRKAATV